MAKIQDIVAQYWLPLDLWVQTPSLDRVKLPVQTAEFHKVDCYRDPDFGTSRAGPRPLPSGVGAISWVVMAVGAAVAALAGGAAVYGLITGSADGESDPAAGPKASATPELDAVEAYCMSELRRAGYATLSDTSWNLALKTATSEGSHRGVFLMRMVFQYLREQGLSCPGFLDFERNAPGVEACNTLFEFGAILGSSSEPWGGRSYISNAVGNMAKRSGTGVSTELSGDERAALLRDPHGFQNVLKLYFTRICAPGVLGAAIP